MNESNFNISIGAKSIECILTCKKGLSASHKCVVLGHGASGDASTGNLPSIATSLAEEGFSVLRYSTAGQLATRVKALEAR